MKDIINRNINSEKYITHSYGGGVYTNDNKPYGIISAEPPAPGKDSNGNWIPVKHCQIAKKIL